MYTIKTIIKESPIHGIGVFSLSHIKKDSVVWVLDYRVDRFISLETFIILPKETQEHILHFGHLCRLTGMYFLAGDNNRFTNHSSNPTVNAKEFGVSYAAVDICVGDELTEDYSEFWLDFNNFKFTKQII